MIKDYLVFLMQAFRLSFTGSRQFYLWMALLTFIAVIGGNAYVSQLVHGLKVTGLTDEVSWGVYIANFTFLVGVAAAIRKYIAIMPMDRMGELAALLETGHRSTLPIDLEIEVAKMVYRNFEVHPPIIADPQPELAQRFWEMAQAYINPRLLLRDKYSAATSLAIEAIVSMRSPLAEQACQAANTCPYRWFAELVSDDLDDLRIVVPAVANRVDVALQHGPAFVHNTTSELQSGFRLSVE